MIKKDFQIINRRSREKFQNERQRKKKMVFGHFGKEMGRLYKIFKKW